MQTGRTRGADLLVRTLADAGVRYLFTVSGNHIMAVFDATIGTSLRLVHARHEAAAVHMADAWGRLTGDPGIALVTGGPGHANALSALFTARMSESPVVLLSGHAPLSQAGRGAFQEMHQADMAQPVCKSSRTVTTVDEIAIEATRALHTARSGRPGPVHLSLPTDVLEAHATVAGGGESAARPPDKGLLAPVAAKAIIDQLRNAARPVILIGPLAFAAQLRDRVPLLQDAMGVPVIGMQSPRGINDPALGRLAEMLSTADCVLLLCKRMDFTLRIGAAFAGSCKFIQVDPEPGEFERTARAVGAQRVEHFIADPVPAIETLIAEAGTRRFHGTWSQDVDAAIRSRKRVNQYQSAATGQLHPAAACQPLQALFDRHPDAVMVADGGEFGQWAQASVVARHRVINGPAGAIGSAVPMAIAARLVHPDAPIVAFSGDGAFGFHIAEYETALRYQLPFVAVVGNDARWNAEYQIQLRSYGAERAIACDLLPVRYDRVAAAFGAYGEHVDHPDQIGPAATRAHASGLASCIDVAIEGLPAPTLD